MKRYEQFNELEQKTDSPEVQALGMLMTEIIDNAEDIAGESREETLDNYTNKFKAVVEWLKEEVQDDQKD